jgi:hypothetical protein
VNGYIQSRYAGATMNTLLYESTGVRFYLNTEIPCLLNEWEGFIPKEKFRSAILTLVDVLKTQRALHGYTTLNLLADTRKLGVISPAEIAWVNEEINPLYLQNGATHEAFVLSSDAFGQAAVKRYVSASTRQGQFTVQLFDSIEDATAWLQKVSPNVPVKR